MNSTFDFELITDEMGMDREDILHLMNLYKTELQNDLLELEDNLSTENWTMAKNKLHKMKGDAANLCLNALAECFLSMEEFARIHDSNLLSEQMDHARTLQAHFVSAFEEFRTKDTETKL